LSGIEMVVIITATLAEVQAQAALLGYIVLPPPLPGHEYIQKKDFNGSKFIDSDGGLKPKKQKERKQFVKFYGEVWEALGMKKVLSSNEVYCITLLFPYCEINSNFLVEKHKGKTVRPLDLNDIARIISREERQTKRILKSLTDKNILFHGESGGFQKYCVNPEIYWNGGDITKYQYFKTMFYTERDCKIARAKEQIEKAGKESRDKPPKLKVLNVNGHQTSLLH